ncbi:DUF4367 domain-containing protein [Paenibacillus sp. MWE-103]|uniref:DUF4367 domain-containing protein n=1 Tax=Paenibacillus artemisiicola TaxID=1172618 RepID=A0ABS3WKS9_9BACL|nr:DUF4367 domain-containing protein [Paenibacillus artemisiicola]MBO7748735.1 DUF4367 domain-containing protein [Paenibacillus artemisiicola]
MARQNHDSQDEDLKRHSISIDEIPVSRITSRVMRRVLGHEKNKSSRRIGRLRIHKGALAAAIALMMFFISVSAYAAAEYLQLRNQKGEVVLQTSNNSLPTNSECGRLINSYREAASKSIEPGADNGVAYYVKGSEEVCGQVLLGFEYGADYGLNRELIHDDTSDAFIQVMNEKLSPTLTLKPDFLPEGFHYLTGTLVPTNIDRNEYKRLSRILTNRAMESSAKNVLFTEPITWHEADSALISFVDDSHQKIIDIMAVKLHGQKVDMNIPKHAVSQKLSFNEQEVIYVGKNTQFTNKALWYQNINDILITAWDSPNSGISEEDFLKMIESIVE